MQFLLLLVVCVAIFGPVKCTLGADVRDNSSVINHELAEMKDQLQVLGDCDLKELWVSSVPGFSSEFGGSWAATKIIGPSDVYPRYGDISGSWTPKPLTANDYIELEFESALYIKEVLIYETYHAGAVKTVEFRNPEGIWDVQARYTPTDIRQSRIFTVDTQNSTYRTNQVKLTLDCTVAPSWVEIDAVKIKGIKDVCLTPTLTTWLG